MKLTIVIPALNEEASIGAIVERSLAAKEAIRQESPVDAVEILVVSDGSTDRTAEIARGYAGVRVIVFEKNRGYGAAIKQGFDESTGELVGFLDADGTCDPCFFGTLCRGLIEGDAAVAIGSRMGPESQMPRIRRIGNRLYALILSVLSNRKVTDTASGMRVLRRSVLAELYPLPDGLHFTPAMSARVLMDGDLRLVECPMPYRERVGVSKLRVFKDGLRFLQTILGMTLVWRPAKLFLMAAVLCLTAMSLLAMHPVEMWFTAGRLQEDMIYRLLFCSLLGCLGAMLTSAGVLAGHLHGWIDPRKKHTTTYVWTLLDRVYTLRWVLTLTLATVPVLLWLVGRGIWTWTWAGYVDLHWSRVVLGGLFVFWSAQMLTTVLLVNIVRFHKARSAWLGTKRIVSTTSAEAAAVGPLPTSPVTRDGIERVASAPVMLSARQGGAGLSDFAPSGGRKEL